MEVNINIAEILKNKPQGTKLYSSICGVVELKEVLDVHKKKSIVVKELNSSNQHRFWYDGKFFRTGQCVLQPSKGMTDWGKFTWRKGDVLISVDKRYKIIFEKFVSDTYMSIVGKHCMLDEGYCGATYICAKIFRSDYFELPTEDTAKTFYCTIEEKLGGKLNRETLKIEKAQPEFKDGDVVVVDEIPFDLYSKCIFILKENLNTGEIKARAYVLYNVNKDSIYFDTLVMKVIERNIHLATEDEKQQLFSALAKEGKAWDAEKKTIVDLKPKVELKPFDKVLCRDDIGEEWNIDLFESMQTINKYNYKCMANIWKFCIPYEGNEHLLGTTKDVEG